MPPLISIRPQLTTWHGVHNDCVKKMSTTLFLIICSAVHVLHPVDIRGAGPVVALLNDQAWRRRAVLNHRMQSAVGIPASRTSLSGWLSRVCSYTVPMFSHYAYTDGRGLERWWLRERLRYVLIPWNRVLPYLSLPNNKRAIASSFLNFRPLVISAKFSSVVITKFSSPQ